MSSLKIIVLTIVTLSTVACSLTDPFVDRRRNAGATEKSRLYVGRSTPEKPSVCYNGLWTSDETLQTLADEQCQQFGTGTEAVKTDTEHFSCRLFLPTRANYQCISNQEDHN